MKFAFLFCTFVFINSSLLFSQSKPNETVSFGVNGGYVSSNNQIIDYNSELVSKSAKSGIKIGMIGKISIGSNFYFEPEINYINKGGNYISKKQAITASHELSMHFLEIPLSLTYHLPIKSSTHFFVGLGYNFSLGLAGKDNIKYSNNTSEVKTVNFYEDPSYNYSTTEIYSNRFEHSINFLAGAYINKSISVRAEYSHAVTSLLSVYDVVAFKTSTGNYFSVSICYMPFKLRL